MESEPKGGRSRLLIFIVLLALVFLIIAGLFLTLSGPAIGNIFSSVTLQSLLTRTKTVEVSFPPTATDDSSTEATPPPSYALPETPTQQPLVQTAIAYYNAQSTVQAQSITRVPPTRTPFPSDTPIPPTGTPPMTLVATAALGTVTDTQGRYLGEGELRVYAPLTMRIDSAGELARIELVLQRTQSGTPIFTQIPPPSETPRATLPASWTPLPMVPGGKVGLKIYEWMGTQIVSSFEDRVSARLIEPDSPLVQVPAEGSIYVTWLWQFVPKAVGNSKMTVYYFNRATQNGADRDRKFVSFDLAITAIPTPVSTQTNPAAIAIPILLLLIAVAGGTWALAARRRTTPGSALRLPPNTIFISYRRSDSQAETDRIFEHLSEWFGKGRVFMDLEGIPAGSDFRQVLRDALKSTRVVLVMIGSEWLTVADGSGARRLDNKDDFVRLEINAALSEKHVIPVRLNGAKMPGAVDLPEDIRELAYRNAVDVRSGRDFKRDIDDLIAALEGILKAKT